MVSEADTKDLYWFGLPGGIRPYVQFELLVLLARVCSRGDTNWRERERSQVSVFVCVMCVSRRECLGEME